LVKWIDQTYKVKKVNILGWSWGTITTSWFAAKYPELVNRLVLLSPIYHGFGVPAPTKNYQPFDLKSTEDDFPKIAGTDQVDFNKIDKRVVNTYLQEVQAVDGAGSPNGGRKDLSQDRSVALFDPTRLTMPVLVIGGTDDPYIDWNKDIPYVFSSLPNPVKKLVKMDDAKHALMLEKNYYQAFQKDVIEFLQ